MKEKGFTLVELLGVLVILGLLATIIYPLVSRNINQAKDDLFAVQKENILEGARTWGSSHIAKLPTQEGKSVTVTLKELEEEGLVDEDLQNPKTNKPLSKTDVKVVITYKGGVLKYVVEGLK